MSTAFIFPGQGSQSIGMLADIAAEHPVIEETFAQASEALGYDLWSLIQNGPESDLGQTHITQPAILTASVALWNLLQQQGVEKPSYVAGHSLGEYSALVCAGVISLQEAVKLVEHRGKLMQEAVPAGTGAMAAVLGLDDQVVIDICSKHQSTGVVQAVNFNSPGQIVIAGEKDAVKAAMADCEEQGAKKVIELAVSVPSHCDLMKPAADAMKHILEDMTFNQPEIQLVNNVNVAIEMEAETIKQALIEQLYKPVRWTETIEYLDRVGVDSTVECGPGKVLSGLNRRIVRAMAVNPIGDLRGLEKFL
jgi:[acyl-carrier-protein] S-malonyltransferase